MKIQTSSLLFLVAYCFLVEAQRGGGLNQNILITLPDQSGLIEFFYIPTTKGYRYGYELSNGLKRQEYGVINGVDHYSLGHSLNPLGAGVASSASQFPYSNINSLNVHPELGVDLPVRHDALKRNFNANTRNEFRQRSKNRKLSPKGLQSLAG